MAVYPPSRGCDWSEEALGFAMLPYNAITKGPSVVTLAISTVRMKVRCFEWGAIPGRGYGSTLKVL